MDDLDIFSAALELGTPEERERYLLEACGDDTALRERIEALLRSSDKVSQFMESPAVAIEGSPTLDRPITEKPGTQIGPYKLLQQLGEGGMGVVYMAEQKEPVKRRVALKIIKPGMDTRQVIARFEAERQALAMMDHPNIAKVLDAGQTESGRPYFVMELVNGISITQYCDEQHLTPRERLELFVPICQAVQHAHQKGIIHRDLKPSNILVAEYDHQAVPKIIDFGVAKATSQTLTEKTMFTQLGQIVGTLEYMSPEQAKRNQLDVDTRSDIYSLGVVLYELLTGETPFDRERLRSAAFDEMLRIIREEEPSKPSTKVSSSLSLPSIAANRRIEPAKLGRMIRGELDWIVLKAMEKDRARRYETASKFAEDVQHYLNDEAVVACPPSRAYKLRKFARRNKFVIAATAAIAASLIAGIIGTSWQAYRATKAEGIAEKRLSIVELQKSEIEQEKQKAVAEAERADEKAAIARAVTEFLNRDLLGMADPAAQAEGNFSPDPHLTLRAVLDRASERIEGNFLDQPQVEVEIHNTLAWTYQSIGIYDEAEIHSRRASQLCLKVFGSDHPDTAGSTYNLAIAVYLQGRYQEADPLFEQTLQIQRQALGLEHPDTLRTMNYLAVVRQHAGRFHEAEQLLQQAVTIQQRILGEEHLDTLYTMDSLGSVYRDKGQYLKAEEVLRRTLEIRRRVRGEEHPETIHSMIGLARVFRSQERYTLAEDLYQQTQAIALKTLGIEHPDTLAVMNNLANVYRLQARYTEAEQLHKETLAIRKRTLGVENRHTMDSMQNLANVFLSQGRYDEAEQLYRDTLGLKRRVFGREDQSTLVTLDGLARVYFAQKDLQQAAQVQEEDLELRHQIWGDDHPDTLSSMEKLAFIQYELGHLDESKRLLRRLLEILRRCRGEQHPQTAAVINALAELEEVCRKPSNERAASAVDAARERTLEEN